MYRATVDVLCTAMCSPSTAMLIDAADLRKLSGVHLCVSNARLSIHAAFERRLLARAAPRSPLASERKTLANARLKYLTRD